MLLNEDKRTAYLIELKGGHLKNAVEQLVATETAFKKQLHDYVLMYRIVASKSNTHQLNHPAFNRFKMKKGDAFRHENNVLIDYI